MVETGPDVTETEIGDRVTVHPFAVTCEHFRYCRQGELSHCRERLSFGSGVDGAFAPYLVIPASIVRHPPENIDFDCGALTEPLTSCVKAINESTAIQAGDVVMVTSPGPIGLLAGQLAKAQGVTVITVGTAVDDQRLKLARTLRVDYTFQAETDDINLAVNVLTNGEYEQITLKGIRVTGSSVCVGSSPDLSSHSDDSGCPLISTVLPLTEWEQGFRRMRQKEGLKVLLHPVD